MISLHHTALWVTDIEQMRRFYMTYFQAGSSVKYINPAKQYTSYFLSFGKGGGRLELMHVPDLLPALPEGPKNPERRQGWAHISISVGSKEAVDALTERLRNDGYRIAGEPRTTGDGYYESIVLDPEGNQVEICA